MKEYFRRAVLVATTIVYVLSYRDATLDFTGLHTACICGSNGAGKSTLLEAIAWAIWGQSRAAAEHFPGISSRHSYSIAP